MMNKIIGSSTVVTGICCISICFNDGVSGTVVGGTLALLGGGCIGLGMFIHSPD